jgi:phospholipid transport system substrate-binding protein
MRIKQTVDDVLKVIQNQDLNKSQKRDIVKGIVRTRFDYRAMSQLVLAVNWRKASAEQQDRFVELFRELLERTYFSAMDNYAGQTVRMGRERLKENRAVVETFVKNADKDVPVDYALRLVGGEWLAYDVTVDGVSLVSNYRTSFRDLIRDKGMDGLLENLQQKIDSFAEEAPEANKAAKG